MEDQLPTRLRRILRLLSLIQSGTRLNAGRFAAELGVSRRTIFRDVNLLRDASVPIHFDEVQQCYRVDLAYRLPRVGALTDEEINLLALAATTSPLNGAPDLARIIQQALLHLMSTLRQESKQPIVQLIERCTYIAAPDQIHPGIIKVFVRGIQQQRKLLVQLREPQSPFDMAPYHLLVSGPRWSIIGLSSLRAGECRLDLQKVSHATLTPLAFERPTVMAFDLASNPAIPEL